MTVQWECAAPGDSASNESGVEAGGGQVSRAASQSVSEPALGVPRGRCCETARVAAPASCRACDNYHEPGLPGWPPS